jgi:serine/threonine protein phosphatase PrpC
MTNALVIQEKTRLSIDNFQLEILSYLGQITAGIHYFKVNIETDDRGSTESQKLGLLRVGSTEGGLKRELDVRELLIGYKMISELLAQTIKDSVTIETRSSSQSHQQPEPEKLKSQMDFHQIESFANLAEPTSHQAEQNNEESASVAEDATNKSHPKSEDLEEIVTARVPNSSENTTDQTNAESEHLEEEYYPEVEMCGDGSDRKLLVLTYLPEEKTTLQSWLGADNSLESSLSITSQVCQFFRHIHQQGWCFVQILPEFIEIGIPLKFFDLTGAYPLNEKLKSGLLENYCAPELAYSHPIQEAMSSYTVGALLYHAIHKQPLSSDNQIDIKINPIPRIYQLLKIALSPLPEERFPLSQLVSLLVETRQSLQATKIHWNVASQSTTGLSTSRLQNEDSYGIRQLQLSNSETLILGVVADGMGGMSQGEVASKLAVQTVLEEPIPAEFNSIEQQSEWLVSLVQKANESVATNVRDGGTTLSITLAVGQDLAIAHVGDSRIYLLRQGEDIRQLSEDHSLVAMLVASGQITHEESLDHPDRNVLTKSIGSKRRLSDGYVQQLSRSGQNLSLPLENGDILLLCSDGVWDLVSNEEIAKIFTHHQTLQTAVDEVINCVLQRGAPDNATLLALELSCHLDNRY